MQAQRGRGVVVARLATEYAFQAALGLQEASMLRRYVTGFYYKPSGEVARAVRHLPARARGPIERELLRRVRGGLDPELVQAVPAPELPYVIASRLGASGRLTRALWRRRTEWFDRAAARVVAVEHPSAVVGYSSSSLSTFKEAKRRGIRRILHQTIAHARFGEELMRQEAELHPDFADSIALGELDASVIDRVSEEALLAEWVIADSGHTRDTLVRHGVDRSRITVVPYGTDVERFSFPAPRRDTTFRLLFVGQISQRKGIKYLLEAVKQLNLPHSELLLVGGVIGKGRGLARYRGHFKHVQSVPYHEVHAYFNRSDVFVFPSLWEGSAIAIYEALGSGLPVITTPNSGSIVRDGVEGYIVPIRDVEALKERIALLHADAGLRAELGHNARQRAEEFTWRRYRQRLSAAVSAAIGPTAETA